MKALSASTLHGSAPEQSETVLLVLDMFSDFAFPGGERLVRSASRAAANIAKLRVRAARAGVATVFVNDNNGRWRSDFPGLVAHCAAPDSRGRAVAKRVLPLPKDYAVLKPKHSGFFATPLDTLLRY